MAAPDNPPAPPTPRPGTGHVPPQEPTPDGDDPALSGTAEDPDPARPPWGSYGPGYAPASIGQLRTFGSGLLGGWMSANDGGEFG